jgi:hypothetical protein
VQLVTEKEGDIKAVAKYLFSGSDLASSDFDIYLKVKIRILTMI